jgi:NADH dehydrogenase/NADH:ubiquinone oxidoreductase subunit G
MTVKILVDDKNLEVKKGRSVLQACLENDIYIPHLCFMEGMSQPPASCRLCFVEVAGMEKPVTSCTLRVSDGMLVRTDTPAVRRLQRTGLRLLLSVHHIDCKNCPANKNCELQRLARFLGVGLKPKGLESYLKEMTVDDSHPSLTYYPNRCVLCGKCIHVCRTKHGQSLLAFARRGFNTTINFYVGRSLNELPCGTCTACVDICPVAALARSHP